LLLKATASSPLKVSEPDDRSIRAVLVAEEFPTTNTSLFATVPVNAMTVGVVEPFTNISKL
jgi:hypothetical protein